MRVELRAAQKLFEAEGKLRAVGRSKRRAQLRRPRNKAKIRRLSMKLLRHKLRCARLRGKVFTQCSQRQFIKAMLYKVPQRFQNVHS